MTPPPPSHSSSMNHLTRGGSHGANARQLFTPTVGGSQPARHRIAEVTPARRSVGLSPLSSLSSYVRGDFFNSLRGTDGRTGRKEGGRDQSVALCLKSEAILKICAAVADFLDVSSGICIGGDLPTCWIVWGRPQRNREMSLHHVEGILLSQPHHRRSVGRAGPLRPRD